MMDYGMGFGIWGVVSTAINIVLGGGFVYSIITIRSQRDKAKAEAKGAMAQTESTELDNVEKAVKIWREMAEMLEKELRETRLNYERIVSEVDELKRAVKSLNCTHRRVLKLLTEMSHDNYREVATAIQQEIENNQ